jgi:hypothetical protein
VRGGNPEQGHTGLAPGSEKLIGADRARADKNQGESADEFRDELLGQAIHQAPPEEDSCLDP